MSDFRHGREPWAEEIALHQKYLTLEGQIDAARLEGDEAEARRLAPLVKRAKARWIKANRRVTRGSSSGRSSSASAPASEVRHEELVTPGELLVILGAIQLAV